MKQYICPKELCDLYDTCPISHKMDVYEQSYPDSETGEILYTATCKEIGETFCNLRSESLIGKDDCEEVSDNLDAESYICIMNMFFDKADDYFNRIMKSVSKHGPTKFVMPQEKIDSLKEMQPHQADEIDRVFHELAVNGFEPHQFLLPNDPFMAGVLQPFSDDFFEYRVKAGDEYYSRVDLQNEINGNRARFRNSWSDLGRKLNELLPKKSSVLRMRSAASKMLGLFDKRLMSGGLFEELPSYNHALDVLKEKLEDVAADLQEKNYERMQAAEEKRKRKSEVLEEAFNSIVTQGVKLSEGEKKTIAKAVVEELQVHSKAAVDESEMSKKEDNIPHQADGDKGDENGTIETSHSKYLGHEYGGVKVEKNGAAVTIYGHRLKFRGRKIWDIVDKIIDAYIDNQGAKVNNGWVNVSDKEFAGFTSKNAVVFMGLIHQETYEEINQKRPEGNCVYTGRVRLKTREEVRLQAKKGA